MFAKKTYFDHLPEAKEVGLPIKFVKFVGMDVLAPVAEVALVTVPNEKDTKGHNPNHGETRYIECDIHSKSTLEH